jgi:hypothetical protein
MLRKIDPLAQVAHLAYGKTLEKPKKVTPLEGVFLEYAPMYRKFELPLTEKQLKDLKENLTIFPKKTAHILEYWLDESLASWWKRDTLVKLPWNKNYFTRDIKDYRNLGINSITTFAAWLNQEYIDQHGVDHFEQIFREYGEVLYNSESKVIDAKLEDWNGGNPTIGLTDPWDLKDKDHTVFDYKIADGCFYFYFKTKDSTLTVSPFTKELSVAEGDRVELFFSPNKELSNYYCVEIGPKGDVLDYSAAYYRKFNEDWNFKALEVSTLVLDDGYIVEGKIDLDELEALNLIDTIYLGVFRADFHDKEKVNWHTKTIPDVETPDFHTPTAFEKISLKE